MPRNNGKWAYTYTYKANLTKDKLKQQGFKRYQRYKYFGVYSKYDKDGNFLYHECFSWFDLGKIIKPEDTCTYQINKKEYKTNKAKKYKPYKCKQHRGGI